MAVVNGSFKVKLTEMKIGRANPVPYAADYQVFVQDRNGIDVQVGGGSTTGNFGTPTAWRAMTGTQMETAILSAITADPKTPVNDSVT